MMSALSLLCSILYYIGPIFGQSAAPSTTAWQHSRFNLDVSGLVSRSNIVLQRPNRKPEEAMPLGNGRVGVAIWAENGLTIQLNRADTLPQRLSPGQIVMPGLSRLTSAPDYAGKVDLYNGEFVEQGNGMTATVYLQPDNDLVIAEVTGADPEVMQTAEVRLWAPRHPQMQLGSSSAVLSETWIDSNVPGATGRTFGSMAALTVVGREIHSAGVDSLDAKLSFLPEKDGSFRVLVAVPKWAGGNAMETARSMLSSASTVSSDAHRRWWNSFWSHAGLMKLSSHDGSAEYFENLRMIDLFAAAAESGGSLPGSQAGVGDLFSSGRDYHKWDPSAYWHFNLRMQVAANLGAGLFALNEPYFRLYRDNLPNIEAWTKSNMQGRPGACVPETMRFNGQGIEHETWTPSVGLNCVAASPPYYNARTISTGAEVSLWIWRQYLATDDQRFLAANYPVMAASARFLLAYSQRGKDGLLHTFPSNAHENQWDVHDPVTDISAMRSLFPAVISAAQRLHTDSQLVRELRAVFGHISQLPRTDSTTMKKQLDPASDGTGQDVIAQSYDQSATVHNSENLGLEPVWPYSIIGDEGPLHDLGVRTYQHRPFKLQNDWSWDPIQAARLGLSAEVKSSLIQLTKKYQAYPSGLASFIGPEFYVEQIGVVAAALEEALAQDYDGLIRIAPAWPSDWDAIATVYTQRNSQVHVQISHGTTVTVVLEAGFSGHVRVRNPWPGQPVQVVSGVKDERFTPGVSGSILDFTVERGRSYVIRTEGLSKPGLAPVEGEPAARPKSLGNRHIGLLRSVS